MLMWGCACLREGCPGTLFKYRKPNS